MRRDVLISILDSGEIERYAIYSRYLNVSDPITVKVQNCCLFIVKSAYKTTFIVPTKLTASL